MEEILKKLGISERTIGQMKEICPNLQNIEEEEILEHIEILKIIGCDEIQIRNIISSNALYLDRTKTDINKLINKMEELGFNTLNVLFDGNPYILNIDDYELDKYIKDREEKGEKKEDIIDDLSSNLYLFEEI